MVESAIYFLIGFLTAGLLALAAAPAISRRAARLARARARLLAPLSETEARAERDALRGQHAVEIARMEQRVRSVEDNRAGALAGLGRRATQIVHLEDLATERAAEIQRQRDELAGLNANLTDAAAQNGAFQMGLRDIEAQRDAADVAHRQASERVDALEIKIDENRAVIASLETRAASLDVELADVRRSSLAAARAAEAERARLNSELASSASAAAALRAELEGAQKSLQTSGAELAARTREAESLKARLMQLQPALARSEAAREELALENSRQLGLIADRYVALDRSGNTDLQREIETLRARLVEADSEIKTITRGDQALRQSIARLGREIAKSRSDEEEGASIARIVSFTRREPSHAPDLDLKLDQPLASEG